MSGKKINLFFKEFYKKEMRETLGHSVIRLMGCVGFETLNGSQDVRIAVIDTGA